MNGKADNRAPTSRARIWLAVLATAVALVVLALFFGRGEREASGPDALVVGEPTNEQAEAPRRVTRRDEDLGGISPEPAPTPLAVPSTPRPDSGPVGVHAFPPLGTRPQLVGIIVPDDFELPPGYLRHYQSTDDGQRLTPILMFDPARPPLDAFGEPMEIPPDRIVPPALAPLGMPIDILELPEPPDSDSRSLRGLLRSG